MWGAGGVSAYCLTRVGLPECLPGPLGCLSFPRKVWVGDALPAPSPGSPGSPCRACSQLPPKGLLVVMDTLRARASASPSKGAQIPWTAYSPRQFFTPRPCTWCPGGPCPGEAWSTRCRGWGDRAAPRRWERRGPGQAKAGAAGPGPWWHGGGSDSFGWRQGWVQPGLLLGGRG